MTTEKKIKEWNEKSYPYRIINVEEEPNPTSKSKFNAVKIFLIVFGVIVVLAFLALFGFRTYYYENFRDNVEATCEPINNVTLEVQPTNCGDVDVNCNCLNSTDLDKILKDVCPNNINVYVNVT